MVSLPAGRQVLIKTKRVMKKPFFLKIYAANKTKINYIIAGIWNTVFGYIFFAFLYLCFSKIVHYMILFVVSNILSITNAYISYKFFVFKTKSNYLKEYMRFYVVYGFSLLLGIIFLPIFVELFHINPLIAQVFIIVITVVISYIGHKEYSFGVR